MKFNALMLAALFAACGMVACSDQNAPQTPAQRAESAAARIEIAASSAEIAASKGIERAEAAASAAAR